MINYLDDIKLKEIIAWFNGMSDEMTFNILSVLLGIYNIEDFNDKFQLTFPDIKIDSIEVYDHIKTKSRQIDMKVILSMEGSDDIINVLLTIDFLNFKVYNSKK